MRQRTQLIMLVGLWAAIYLTSAPYPPALLDDADTVHAEAAREMAESNNFVTLYANRIRYLEKAPLMYWLVALAYKLFGVSEFASRLPVALGALALTLAVYFFGKHFFNQKAGFYAGLAIVSCVGIFLFTRVLWPDVLLTFFITMAFYCFLRAGEGEPVNGRWAYGLYAFAALGVLTKGLVGAAFPAIIIGVYMLVSGEIRRLFQYRLIGGTLLFLLIAAPWHVAAGLQNPGSLMTGTPSPTQGRGFFWFYFMNEHFLRYIGKRYPVDYDTVPLALFLALHLVWLFPWSFFLPLAVKNVATIFKPQRADAAEVRRGEIDTSASPRRVAASARRRVAFNWRGEQRTLLFLALWAVLIILFFCFSTTQEYYTMPSYAAFALLIGHAIARAESEWQSRRGRRWLIVTQITLAVLGAAVFMIGVFVYLKTRGLAVEGDLTSTLTRNPEAYALSLGHVLDLTPQSLAALGVPVIGAALAFGAGGLAAFVFRWRAWHAASSVALAIMMAAFFFFARQALAEFSPYLSSRPLAEAINREIKDGDVIVINGEYEGGSSINFYTRRQVHILNGRAANLEYGSYFNDAPPIFLNDAEIARRWREAGRIFLVTDAAQLEQLKRTINALVFTFAESGGKLVVTNQQS
jgi:4-amino-4-deoxy-L-arabinose transferase-like glycosyltransferase